jgi:hypothetical protein
MGTVWILGAMGRDLYWAPLGGGLTNMRPWMSPSLAHGFVSAIGLFGSPAKGLFVFAPALIIAIYALPKAFHEHRDLTVFAILVTAGTVGFLSLMVFPFDEVWGPRYMHVTIAPLLVCIGAARPRFSWRRDCALLALLAIGVLISFLGAFYYYGARGSATGLVAQNTMENLTQDHVWNEFEFSMRAFQTYLKPGTEPEPWIPGHLWVWAPPPGVKPDTTAINMRDFSVPQSLVLRMWNTPTDPVTLGAIRFLAISTAVGVLAMLVTLVRTLRERDNPRVTVTFSAEGVTAEPTNIGDVR